jgi:hypothetical protein
MKKLQGCTPHPLANGCEACHLIGQRNGHKLEGASRQQPSGLCLARRSVASRKTIGVYWCPDVSTKEGKMS